METYRGSVDVRGLEARWSSRVIAAWPHQDGRPPRNVRLETYRGDITLSLPRESGFQLDSNLGRHAGLYSDFQIPTRVGSRWAKAYRVR